MKQLARLVVLMAPSVTAVALLVVLLGSCGSTSHRASGGAHYGTALAGRACSPGAYYMQCAHGAAGQLPNSPALSFSSPALFGIDFAWGGPSGYVARSLGAHFGVSYLSGSSKDWSRALLYSYAAAGLGRAFVWETSQYRALSGCAAGSADARAASNEEAALGEAGAPVFVAVDFDSSAYSSTGVLGQYLRCELGQLGSRAGAYGGLNTMRIAAAVGIRRLWQTLAWSYGAWDPRACLRQYSIDQPWHGYNVDFNLAVCADYGQFSPPPPGPTPAQISRWQGARNASFAVYHRRGCTNGLDRGCTLFAQRVSYFQDKLWAKYPRWSCWGPGARTKTAICWIVRPEVSRWSQERDSSARVARRLRCARPDRRAICGVLYQRARFFDARVQAARKKYSA